MMIVSKSHYYNDWMCSEYEIEDGKKLRIAMVGKGEQVYIGERNGRSIFKQFEEDSLVAQIFDENEDFYDWCSASIGPVENENNIDEYQDEALKFLAKQLDKCTEIENASFIIMH